MISTALFAIALVPLGLLAARHAGAERARWSVILCACSPFAVFFGLPYTESLFLLATTALVLCFEQRRFAPAIAAGIVAGLTRPTAVVVAGGLAAALAVNLVARRHRGDRAPNDDVLAWLAAASPLMGMAIYSAYVWGLTGHPFMWALVQDAWGRPAQNPIAAIGTPLLALLAHPLRQIAREPHVTLNVVAGIAALALVWPITKRLGIVYGSVVLGGTLLPLAAGGVASLGRYTAVLFPIYVWLAAVTPRPGLPVVAVLFACVQVVVAALFFTWRPMYLTRDRTCATARARQPIRNDTPASKARGRLEIPAFHKGGDHERHRRARLRPPRRPRLDRLGRRAPERPQRPHRRVERRHAALRRRATSPARCRSTGRPT